MSQSERFEVGQKKNVEIIFLVNLRLSFSETIESPDSSISYLLRSLKIESVTLTFKILQDLLVLHLLLKSVIAFTFNSFLYYIPVIQEFFFTSIFNVYIDWIKVVMKAIQWRRRLNKVSIKSWFIHSLSTIAIELASKKTPGSPSVARKALLVKAAAICAYYENVKNLQAAAEFCNRSE